MSPIRVSINNQQDFVKVDRQRVIDAIQRVVAGHGFTRADVSLAIVDDARIQTLNRIHLNHDYPTDVLSFVYEATSDNLDAELIVSGETARRAGAEHGMAADDELLLYVVHGSLHLVGFDDQTDEARTEMRASESTFLKQLGISLTAPIPGDDKRQEMVS
jgi:probable rRNA maturation factor